MGRHADRATGLKRGARSRRVGRPLRVSVPVVAVCLLIIGAVVLGVWWWNLRSVTDPIDADPVDAYAVVLSSPSCVDGGVTKVRISGSDPPVTATLSGCGFATDQRLAVQYLAGDPTQARLAGTSVAGGSGMLNRLLPIGILAAGLVAVLASVVLLVERRRSRHVPGASRVTVADLRNRAVAAEPDRLAAEARSESQWVIPDGGVGGDGGDGRDGGVSGDDEGRSDEIRADDARADDARADDARADDARADRAGAAVSSLLSTGTAGAADGTPPRRAQPDVESDGAHGHRDARAGAAGARRRGDPSSEVQASSDPDAGGGARSTAAAGRPHPDGPLDAAEPAHVLPSGFVIVDEQLFTHSGPEVQDPQ